MMMKIVFTVCLLSSSHIFSQENIWEPTNGNTGGNIYVLAVSPSDVLFASTTNGLYKSTNNGQAWININNEIGQNRVLSIVFNDNGDIFVGTNPGIGIFKSTDEGETWTHIDDSLVTYSIQKLDINSSGHLFAAIYGHGVYRSNDSGESWEEINSGLSYLTFSELYVSKTGSTKDYIFVSVAESHTYSYVFLSTNDGDSWQQTSYFSDFYEPRVFISNSYGEVYLGTYTFWNTSNATLLKSTDGGLNWLGAGYSGNFGILVLDSDENIYANGDYWGWGCFGPIRTTDRGNNWESFKSGLPDGCYFAMACNSQDVLFIGVDYGVYRTIESTTDISENEEVVPKEFTLSQNYPNPFNPSTKIEYQIADFELVTLKVYDVLGKEVSVLVNEEKQAGSYGVTFDALNLPSGVYFYTLQAGDFIDTKKMTLVK